MFLEPASYCKLKRLLGVMLIKLIRLDAYVEMRSQLDHKISVMQLVVLTQTQLKIVTYKVRQRVTHCVIGVGIDRRIYAESKASFEWPFQEL